MYQNKNGEYESSIGDYWRFKIFPDTSIKKVKTPVTFQLGTDPTLAETKEKRIQSEWKRCKKYGDSYWRRQNIQNLMDENVISQSKGDSIICEITKSLGKAMVKTEKVYGRLKEKLSPRQIQNAEQFGKWLIVTMTERLRTNKFKQQLGQAIDTLAEKDPIAAAKIWLDFSERILGEDTIVQQNIITGIKFTDATAKPLIDTTARENESEKTSES